MLLEKFLKEWSRFDSEGTALEPVEQILPELGVKSWSARGVAMPAASRAEYDKIFEKLMKEMKGAVTKDYHHFSKLAEAAFCGESWWSESQIATMEAVKVQYGLLSCLLTFPGASRDVATKLNDCRGKPDLQLMMTKVKQCEVHIAGPDNAAWPHSQLRPALEEAKGRVAEASNILFSRAEGALKKAIDGGSIARGMPGHQSWTDGLKPDMAWEQLMAHAEKTLAAIPKKDLESLEGDLSRETWAYMIKCRNRYKERKDSFFKTLGGWASSSWEASKLEGEFAELGCVSLQRRSKPLWTLAASWRWSIRRKSGCLKLRPCLCIAEPAWLLVICFGG